MNRDPFTTPARTTRYVLLVMIVGILVGAAPQMAGMAAARKPSADALHIARTAQTERGRYMVTLIVPRPIDFDGWHGWYLRIRDRDGAPVRQADVSIDGWNTDAGHGFASPPAVSWTHIDRYRVGAVRARTPGRWLLTTRVLGPAGADRVAFVLDLH